MEEDLQHPKYAPYKGFPVNPLTRFAQAVRGERVKQDAKWGGPEHDKHHDPKDWYELIVIHLEKAFVDVDGYPCAGSNYYDQLVRVAALAEAAGEDYDRKLLEVDCDTPPVECDAGCRRYKQRGQRYCRICRAAIDAKSLPSEVAAKEAATPAYGSPEWQKAYEEMGGA